MWAKDQAFEQILRQTLGPALEDLQHLGPGISLHLQIMGRGLNQYLKQGCNLVRLGIGVGTGLCTLALSDAARLAVQHIGRDRPGCSGKADQCPARFKLRSNQRQGLTHLFQGFPSAGRQVAHGLDRRQATQSWPFTSLEPDLLPQGSGNQQYVGKDDRGVKTEPTHRLQGRLSGFFRIQAEGNEIRCRRSQGPVFRQVAPGLTHEPDRRASARFSGENLQNQGRGGGNGHLTPVLPVAPVPLKPETCRTLPSFSIKES